MPRSGGIKQFISFCAIGLLNTAVDFVVFVILVWLSVHYAAAQAIAYLAGMVCSYVMNSAFTFRSETDVPRRESLFRKLRFVVWNVLMLGASVGLIAIATDVAGWPQLWSKAGVTGIIVAINFYGSKRWVFRSEKEAVKAA
ncbi:GtrA family protein [Paenibacillus sp. J5C_2022]|uniref:GtrA family protein n=1 Tax=Paenibacillus sp. J5C2022 TaxID=2977129 RepID=UPI0021CEFB0C|nr:GtrA family protein [Paenibacillus sp. J5C2022]MCU6710435.1 GtrA family protein [Paenibacillus sp. J5C2022]